MGDYDDLTEQEAQARIEYICNIPDEIWRSYPDKVIERFNERLDGLRDRILAIRREQRGDDEPVMDHFVTEEELRGGDTSSGDAGWIES